MNDLFKDVKPLVYESKINVPYNWWAGETASKFLISLRDDKKITGTKCSKCNKTYIPPRKICPTCFNRDMTWVDVSDSGTVESFTVVRRQLAALKKKVPVIFALIKLSGADTALLHYLGEIDPGKIKIGMKVKAKFSEKRNGTMLDIEYFKPV